MRQWVTFQLSDRGESSLDEEPIIITRLLDKYIKSEYFLPVHFHNIKAYSNKIYLIKGYIFIEFNRDEVSAYSKLASTHYFSGPLLVNRRLHLTTDEEIKVLKKQLAKLTYPKITVGDTVKVIDGKYKNLEAEVTEVYSKEKLVDLSVKLKCMDILVPKIPLVCLTGIENKPKSSKRANGLQEKVIVLLHSHQKGLTRKKILEVMKTSDKEKKRLSTCLSRAVNKGLLKSFVNKAKRTVFSLAN